MVLCHSALPGAPRINGNVGEFDEFEQLRRCARPEDAVSRRNQGPPGGKEEIDRPRDALWIRARAKLARRIDLRAAALIALESGLVENVCRDLDKSDALGRTCRVAKRLSQIDFDRRPVENSLRELCEGAAHLTAISLLKRA
jgi:hypothetical protein